MAKQFLLLICILMVASPAISADKIILWERNYQRPEFLDFIHLLAQASESEYGDYEIEPSSEMEQGRAFANLNDGVALNVAIAATDNNREATHLPIFFPIDRGLLGFRICLVKPEKQSLFSTIRTLEDFNTQKVHMGLGSHWPDRNIIETNGIKTVHSPIFDSLFEMLKRDRFNCFLRSINEISYDLTAYSELAAEQDIAFLYPLADFIFVSKKASRIHQRLQFGIQQIEQDGRFQEHFDIYYGAKLQEFKFYGRKLLILKNPQLSDAALQAINEYGVAAFTN